MSLRIVLGFDGTTASRRAVDLLAAYAGDARISVIVTTAEAPLVKLWPAPVIDIRAVERAALASAAATAKQALAVLRAAGIRAEAAPALGSATETIVDEAKARGAHLVVMGTRGDGVLDGFAVGSVALRVVHASAVPACLVRPQSRLPRALGRHLKVLLATDGSEPSLRAAATLADWQPWLGRLDVHVVHVQKPLSYLEALLPPHDDILRQWSMEAGHAAVRAVCGILEREKVGHRVHVPAGDAPAEIVRLAAETSADLVVMGTRGLGAAHHALVGSVALKVAAHAPVPVVLVK